MDWSSQIDIVSLLAFGKYSPANQAKRIPKKFSLGLKTGQIMECV